LLFHYALTVFYFCGCSSCNIVYFCIRRVVTVQQKRWHRGCSIIGNVVYRKQIFMIMLLNKNWFLVLYYVFIICQGSMLYSPSGSMTQYSCCFLYSCVVFVVSTASMDFSDYALSSSNSNFF